MDITMIPGLISTDEREFLKQLAARVDKEFENPTIVDIGTYMGASSGCLRHGAPSAEVFTIDVSDKRQEPIPGVTFLLGDSQELWKDFQYPVHLLCLDGEHHYRIVEQDVRNWVLGKLVPGGYVAFHDANRHTGDFAWQGQEIGRAIEEHMPSDVWKELEGADSIRCFRRLV